MIDEKTKTICRILRHRKSRYLFRNTFYFKRPPVWNERSYNALRLADRLVTQENVHVALFLMGDAVSCVKAGQKTPQGYYNIERTLKPILRKGEVIFCGTCMDARGMTDEETADGACRGTLKALTALTINADKVIVL